MEQIAGKAPSAERKAVAPYIYQLSEPGLWTVGTVASGSWIAESDHVTPEAAAARVHYLNGGAANSDAAFAELVEADVEYDEARASERRVTAGIDPVFATQDEYAPVVAAHNRVKAARKRRAAALAAVRGGAK